MKKDLLKIGIRNQTIYIPMEYINNEFVQLSETTLALVANAKKLGFSFSENLLRALNSVNPAYKVEVLNTLKEISGVSKNWTPLVKGWDVPTGESIIDHFFTFFANVFGSKNGTTLACGHNIPANTFPLERYNGCPFCGTPFEFGELENTEQGSKLKVL